MFALGTIGCEMFETYKEEGLKRVTVFNLPNSAFIARKGFKYIMHLCHSTFTYVYISTNIQICMYIYTYINRFIFIFIYIYIYTYIHSHQLKRFEV
jgi:hypothetical protein